MSRDVEGNARWYNHGWYMTCLTRICVPCKRITILLITHPGKPIRVLVWSKSICDPELIPSPDRSWLGKTREA